MSAFEINLWVLGATCLLTWLTSVITKEYSWVDRIWSIIPIVYIWIFAFGDEFSNPRINIMAILVTLWGARLTFNFARKGGYAPGGEDYRWAILREKMSPAIYQVFNILFIVIFQNALLLAITLPANLVLGSSANFTGVDLLFALLFFGFLCFEFVADQQQWNFHQAKKAGTETGFLTKGLFSFSRHPNFFAEQAQWWLLAIWCFVVSGSSDWYYILGAVILTALFIGSARFTEQISASKYPDYANYQKRVSMMIPWFAKQS
jgi:steroid 5-alpha reductase family enzyme